MYFLWHFEHCGASYGIIAKVHALHACSSALEHTFTTLHIHAHRAIYNIITNITQQYDMTHTNCSYHIANAKVNHLHYQQWQKM